MFTFHFWLRHFQVFRSVVNYYIHVALAWESALGGGGERCRAVAQRVTLETPRHRTHFRVFRIFVREVALPRLQSCVIVPFLEQPKAAREATTVFLFLHFEAFMRGHAVFDSGVVFCLSEKSSDRDCFTALLRFCGIIFRGFTSLKETGPLPRQHFAVFQL